MANIETSLLGFERGEQKDLLFRARLLSGDQLDTDYAHASEEEMPGPVSCEQGKLSMASLSGHYKALLTQPRRSLGFSGWGTRCNHASRNGLA